MAKKKETKQEAKDKIDYYFSLADSVFPKDKEQANESVRKARKLAMKHKLRLGKLKRKFCKHCYSYLKTGVNSRVRTNEGKIIIYCSECKKYTRIPFRS